MLFWKAFGSIELPENRPESWTFRHPGVTEKVRHWLEISCRLSMKADYIVFHEKCHVTEFILPTETVQAWSVFFSSWNRINGRYQFTLELGVKIQLPGNISKKCRCLVKKLMQWRQTCHWNIRQLSEQRNEHRAIHPFL
jgi:hypothetical protein